MVSVSAPLPRVTIQFCTQCKWMLRAAYYAQELLSTFGTALGEVALQPSTGGTFIVSLYSSVTQNENDIQVQHLVLWDRKKEGSFPETKELKRRLRDVIQPGRDLGHVDGKQKSVTREIAEHSRQQSNANEESLDHETQEQKAIKHVDTWSQSGINDIQAQEKKSEKLYVMVDKDAEGKVKRNPDSSICEDCA